MTYKEKKRKEKKRKEKKRKEKKRKEKKRKEKKSFNIQRKVSPHDGFRSEDVIIHKSIDNIYYDYQKTLLLISPFLSEKSIEKYKKAIKEVFIKKKGHNAASLMNNLNPIIRGWCNSFLSRQTRLAFKSNIPQVGSLHFKKRLALEMDA